MGLRCLTYVRFEDARADFHDLKMTRERKAQVGARHGLGQTHQFRSKHSFLYYAAGYWADHIRESREEAAIDACIDFLSDQDSVRFWLQIAERKTLHYHGNKHQTFVLECLSKERSSSCGCEPVAAACCGLDTVVLELLKRGMDVNHEIADIVEGRRGRKFTCRTNALVAAVSFKRSSTIELLLSRGAKVQAADWNALCACIETGDAALVRALLQRTDSQNLIKSNGFDEVHYHCSAWRGGRNLPRGFLIMALIHHKYKMIGLLMNHEIHSNGTHAYHKLVTLLLHRGTGSGNLGGLYTFLIEVSADTL